jgi:hypothetical protein
MTMEIYKPTKIGLSIITESGLDILTNNLHQNDITTSLIDEHMELGDRYLPNFVKDEELKLGIALEALSKTASIDEKRTVIQGLDIEPGHDSWRHRGGIEEGTLFPINGLPFFRASSHEDRLIVSGATGLQLTKYGSTCALLDRDRFDRYGFSNFVESCAFVGAYVVSKYKELDRYAYDTTPGFNSSATGIDSGLFVGGTMHGDLIIQQVKNINSGVVSPTGSSLEFATTEAISVGGYHSLEPALALTMLEDEFMKRGRKGTIELIDEFSSTLDSLSVNGSIPFKVGNFGDYGDSDMQQLVYTSIFAMDSEHYLNRRTEDEVLCSLMYSPGSDTSLEMVKADNGFLLRNNNNGISGPVININRSNYVDFFRALVESAAAGAGRTAPYQYVELVESIRHALDT